MATISITATRCVWLEVKLFYLRYSAEYDSGWGERWSDEDPETSDGGEAYVDQHWGRILYLTHVTTILEIPGY